MNLHKKCSRICYIEYIKIDLYNKNYLQKKEIIIILCYSYVCM